MKNKRSQQEKRLPNVNQRDQAGIFSRRPGGILGSGGSMFLMAMTGNELAT